jgi:hypothetical protein
MLAFRHQKASAAMSEKRLLAPLFVKAIDSAATKSQISSE